ncbi:AAA-like domain-containing protein [Crocosphaera sp.]|uniref:AAA-like domain-containing protein n=1 Tax=Crocosphaera sp. TaxID=2729996 RepID=UPI00261470EE|nr:AAA-like domain-containing protein [Crocosphaera sp.]MDJ0582989.1 AAA-like domain-containing protein [Crocosphaera sp.]
MIENNDKKQKRRRGVILTEIGLEKLQNAKLEAEYKENQGKRYTLEDLSEKIGLAMDTLMKVFAGESKVDKQTLKYCFKAFELRLCDEDFFYPQISSIDYSSLTLSPEPELPEGQVPLDSQFYLERSPIETECYKAILQPGALIRLKAPRRMGKSSLLARIIEHGSQNNCAAVSLSFQLADTWLFQDLDKFLRWFCANISLSLNIENKVVDYWDDLFGSKISCKIYFEEYILSTLKTPLVLGLDDVDRLFQYPDLADNFFGLLRAWHEEGKNKDIWKKLRLIVVHSAEVYIPLNLNQSPFNVGIPITLPMFTPQQVQDLAKIYKINWSLKQGQKLMDLVGGNPYLLKLALYHISVEKVTLDELLLAYNNAISNIYLDHLQRQLWAVKQQNTELLKALEKVVLASQPIELDLVESIKLQSLGLVHFQGHKVIISCRLYQQYFQQHFQGLA